MKNRLKTTVAGLLIVASHYSFGQLTKGSVMLGGNIGYTQNTTATTYNQSGGVNDPYFNTPKPDMTSSSLTAGINAGYFLKDNLEAGVGFSYSHSSNPQAEEDNNDTYHTWNNVTSNTQVSLFITKYKSIADKFYIDGSLDVVYSAGKIKQSYLDGSSSAPAVVALPDEPTMGYSISFAPGLVYFPAPKWGIRFSLNNILSYGSNTTKNVYEGTFSSGNGSTTVTSSSTTHGFTVGAGLTPTLGISYIL